METFEKIDSVYVDVFRLVCVIFIPFNLLILKQSSSSLTTLEGIMKISNPLPLKQPSVSFVIFLGILIFLSEVQSPNMNDL